MPPTIRIRVNFKQKKVAKLITFLMGFSILKKPLLYSATAWRNDLQQGRNVLETLLSTLVISPHNYKFLSHIALKRSRGFQDGGGISGEGPQL